MEKSNRKTDYLLGTLRVPASDLTPSEWAMILNETLRNFRPYLKYLSGGQFSEIKFNLNCGLEGADPCDKRSTKRGVVEFEDGIDRNTHCFILTNFLKLEAYQEKKIVPEIKLLLTRKGEWVMWDAEYDVRNFKNEAKFGRANYKRYIARFSKFSFIKEEGDLVSLLTKFPVTKIPFSPVDQEIPVAYNALKSLQEIIKDDIKVRRNRLRQFQKIEKSISSTIDRISW